MLVSYVLPQVISCKAESGCCVESAPLYSGAKSQNVVPDSRFDACEKLRDLKKCTQRRQIYSNIYIYYTIRIHILHKINIMYVYYISHSINYVVHITIYLYAIQFKNYPAALHKMHKYEMPTSQNSFKKNDFMICVSNAEIHRNTTTLGPQQHMEKMKVLICLNPSKDG